MSMTSIKTYSELSKLQTYIERFEYLRLDGAVGVETFGYHRWLNQVFYRSREWRKVRDEVILRDNGCDLGIDGREIFGRVIIHHINPLSREDIEKRSYILFDPENLICTTHETHNAIHYGDETLLVLDPIERVKNDTCPWRK